ncbi:hypothetical protein ACFPOA_15845 [Lysobacter niabensis]|uniref:hypothetical protein n=1 Tax=Agrilutibacter niabensis TaxID=380628 RepID=UPI0036149C2E
MTLVASLLFALAASGPSSQGVAAPADTPATICDIQANKSQYLGKVVTVTAHYSTDSSHYEYLKDASCSNGAILDIGFKVPERDASVEAFEEGQRNLCKERGTPYLCILEGTVTVRGEIAQTTGAHLQPDVTYLIINLHSVRSFHFVDER